MIRTIPTRGANPPPPQPSKPEFAGDTTASIPHNCDFFTAFSKDSRLKDRESIIQNLLKNNPQRLAELTAYKDSGIETVTKNLLCMIGILQNPDPNFANIRGWAFYHLIKLSQSEEIDFVSRFLFRQQINSLNGQGTFRNLDFTGIPIHDLILLGLDLNGATQPEQYLRRRTTFTRIEQKARNLSSVENSTYRAITNDHL